LTYGLFIDRGAIRDFGRHIGKHVRIDEQNDSLGLKIRFVNTSGIWKEASLMGQKRLINIVDTKD
jgi:hypothetical protein